MKANGSPDAASFPGVNLVPIDGEMVELPLLLPGWQAEALEMAAHSRGMTAGQMLRRILGDFFEKVGPHGSPGKREARTRRWA